MSRADRRILLLTIFLMVTILWVATTFGIIGRWLALLTEELDATQRATLRLTQAMVTDRDGAERRTDPPDEAWPETEIEFPKTEAPKREKGSRGDQPV